MYIEIPVTLFAEIAADKVAIANARIRDIQKKNAAHGRSSRDHGGYCDYCGAGRIHGRTAAAAQAAADIANADVDFALALADAAEHASRIMRVGDPLAYSSDHGYID